MKRTLYVNDSADSKEGIRLLEEAGIDFRRVPANGPSMPTFLIGSAEFAGLYAIRLYLSLLRKLAAKRTKGSKMKPVYKLLLIMYVVVMLWITYLQVAGGILSWLIELLVAS